MVSPQFHSGVAAFPIDGRHYNAPGAADRHTGLQLALLSHGLWEMRFGSDAGLVGRALIINDEPVTIAGVLPASFDMASVFAPERRRR
jgi:hypothetical protein